MKRFFAILSVVVVLAVTAYAQKACCTSCCTDRCSDCCQGSCTPDCCKGK